MLVITADTDPLFRRFVAESLSGTEFETKLAEHGQEAWACAQAAAAPLVLMYGWGLPDLGGAEMSRRIRRLGSPRSRYSIATLRPDEASALPSTIEAGVDDVLVKPITAPTLVSRLRLAANRCASPRRAVGTLRDALHEALGSEGGGEIVVRQGDRVGHIYVANAGIVWVNVSGEPLRLGGVVRSAGVALDDEDAAAVIEECRRNRMHFADVLVRWGYLDETGARECVRSIIAVQLGHLLAMQDATALFLPRARAYAGVSFPLHEVAPITGVPPAGAEVGVPSLKAQPDRLARCAELVTTTMLLEGALGAAIIDRPTCAEWAHAGADIDGTLVGSLLVTLNALGPGAEEAIAVRPGAGFLGRVIDPSTVLVAGFDLGKTTLGLARSSINRIVGGRANGGDPRATQDTTGEGGAG